MICKTSVNKLLKNEILLDIGPLCEYSYRKAAK